MKTRKLLWITRPRILKIYSVQSLSVSPARHGWFNKYVFVELFFGWSLIYFVVISALRQWHNLDNGLQGFYGHTIDYLHVFEFFNNVAVVNKYLIPNVNISDVSIQMVSNWSIHCDINSINIAWNVIFWLRQLHSIFARLHQFVSNPLMMEFGISFFRILEMFGVIFKGEVNKYLKQVSRWKI